MKTQNQIEVEQRLLLALLGCRKDVLDDAGLMPLLPQVNWRNFLTNTYRDLYPYLAFRLEQYLERMRNLSELEPLFNARRLTAVNNLRLRYELSKVIDVLRHAGIPVLALKGIVLAHTVYPDPSLRPMSDVDILVPSGKREKAVQVLQSVGFAYPDSVLAMHRDLCLRLTSEQEYAPALRLQATEVQLELHSELECSEPVLPMPLQEFWSRSVVVDFNGLKVRALCPEDFLFHLCLHQSREHRFEKGLLPLVDVKLLLESRSDWDWASIADRSVRCRCATWMYITLMTARDVVGAPVPDAFFQALSRPSNLPRLLGMAKERICSMQSQEFYIPLVSSLLAEPSWRRRMRMFLKRMRFVRRQELEPRLSAAGIVKGTWLFYRRLVATVKSRIPGLIREWKNRRLRVSAIRRTAQLIRQSNILFQLVEQEPDALRDNDRIPSK